MVIFPLRLKMDTPLGCLKFPLLYPQKKLAFLSISFFEVLAGIATIFRQKTSKNTPREKNGKKKTIGWKQTPQGGILKKPGNSGHPNGGVYFQPKEKLPFRQQKYIKELLC